MVKIDFTSVQNIRLGILLDEVKIRYKLIFYSQENELIVHLTEDEFRRLLKGGSALMGLEDVQTRLVSGAPPEISLPLQEAPKKVENNIWLELDKIISKSGFLRLKSDDQSDLEEMQLKQVQTLDWWDALQPAEKGALNGLCREEYSLNPHTMQERYGLLVDGKTIPLEWLIEKREEFR